MSQETRFLTASEKQALLAQWRKDREQSLPPGNLGGRGFPDPLIFGWTDQLNGIEGVCTVQSCSGHTEREGDPGGPGRLWIRLNSEMSRGFNARAFELASDKHIERLYRMYSSWGEEIVDILFVGYERGMLDSSMEVIVRFFRSLRKAIDSGEL